MLVCLGIGNKVCMVLILGYRYCGMGTVFGMGMGTVLEWVWVLCWNGYEYCVGMGMGIVFGMGMVLCLE